MLHFPHCPRSLMDRMAACGVADRGSIPRGGQRSEFLPRTSLPIGRDVRSWKNIVFSPEVAPKTTLGMIRHDQLYKEALTC